MKFKYTFAVGINQIRRVTVRAATLADADLKARAELDRRCDKSGQEPPVGWDLRLINKERVP